MRDFIYGWMPATMAKGGEWEGKEETGMGEGWRGRKGEREGARGMEGEGREGEGNPGAAIDSGYAMPLPLHLSYTKFLVVSILLVLKNYSFESHLRA